MTRRRMSLAMVLTSLAALALGVLQVPSSAARTGGQALGDLHLTFQPYTGPGHEKMPLEVLKFVVERADDNLWVHEWRLQNRSSKDVTKIRLAYFVFRESDPETLLLKHSDMHLAHGKIAPGRRWPAGECVKHSCPNSFELGSAGKLLQPLASGGVLEGDYVICLGIDKVWFADGTVWEFGVTKDV